MADRPTPVARQELGVLVRRAREAAGLSIDRAAARGEMSPVTWAAVEQGKAVRALSYAGVERVLGWAHGSVSGYLNEGAAPVSIAYASTKTTTTTVNVDSPDAQLATLISQISALSISATQRLELIEQVVALHRSVRQHSGTDDAQPERPTGTAGGEHSAAS